MHILMVSDVYFPRINGVSTSIQTFRRSLHAAGHETTLIAPAYPAGTSPDETRVLRIASRYLPRDPEDRLMKSGPLRRLHEELRRESFDLVHIQTPFIAHYEGLRIARDAGVAGDRDVSHVFRRVPASLRAIRPSGAHAIRRPALYRLTVRSARCARRTFASDAHGAAGLRCALSHAHHSDRHGDGALCGRGWRDLSRETAHSRKHSHTGSRGADRA